MFNKIVDLQEEVKHIAEMCLAAVVFPDSLAYKHITAKKIVYKYFWGLWGWDMYVIYYEVGNTF